MLLPLRTVIVVALIAASSRGVSAMNVPPVISASGSYFEVGSAVGKAMVTFIDERWSRSQSTTSIEERRGLRDFNLSSYMLSCVL
ncbi:Hypothetical protein, putative [Bodo saltans]|uniref:Membrane-associated protein n=1 Tax=Bodo saltans TaxID=75058 RepID=A0A0S4JJR0_BODSA|nr:Hypothetical protein, putative [Bodo saltans]|eukprot:CUG90807.1 Hypothetical protein, putative [Bodo saltans]